MRDVRKVFIQGMVLASAVIVIVLVTSPTIGDIFARLIGSAGGVVLGFLLAITGASNDELNRLKNDRL